MRQMRGGPHNKEMGEPSMKQAWIKAMVAKLAATGSMVLFLVLVPAVAAGSLPLWAAGLLAAVGILALNAACGILLPAEETTASRRVQPAPKAQPVQLRVVRGGRAA